MSRVLAVGVALAGAAASDVAQASTPCSGQPVHSAMRTFDAPGHVDTGLHGGEQSGTVTGDLNDVNGAGDVVGYYGRIGTIANFGLLYETRSNTEPSSAR